MCYKKNREGLVFICYLCMLLFSFSMESKAGKDDVVKQAKKIYGEIGVGKGFATYNNEFFPNTALAGFSVETVAPRGDLQFEAINHQNMLETEFGIHASAEVPIKAMNLKSLVSFTSGISDDEHSLSYVYRARWTNQYKVAPPSLEKPLELSEAAQALIKKNKREFFITYGDAFVSEMEAGIALYFHVQVHFSSSKAKADFQGSLGIDRPGLLSLMENLGGFIHHNKTSGYVNVRTIQLGGNPFLLTKIFPEATSSWKEDAINKNVYFTGFSFSDAENFKRVIKAAIDYTTCLGTQITEGTGLFQFGNVVVRPYSTVEPSLAGAESGLLSEDVLKAREYLNQELDKLKQLQSFQVPFYTLEHFPDTLDNSIKQQLSVARDYFYRLKLFFLADEESAQRLCFKSGFEDPHCAKAARELKTYTPETMKDILTTLWQLDFTVDKKGKEVMYPVSRVRYGSMPEQDFVIASEHGAIGSMTIRVPVNKMKPCNDEYKHGIYDLLNIQGIDTIQVSNMDSSSQWNQAKKMMTRVFRLTNDDELLFKESLSLPEASGVIKLHLPFGAGFVAKIQNMNPDDHQEPKITSAFLSASIKARVGDTVKVHPVGNLGLHSLYTFTVTAPYDTEGKLDGMTKLPLGTTINLWGTTANAHYSFSFTH